MWSRKCAVGLFSAAVWACATRADTWWRTWEGTSYPEDDGWQRTVYGGGDSRWFENGSLVLDGLDSIYQVDDYWMDAALWPGYFLMEWRLRVDSVHGFADPVVLITCPGYGEVDFDFNEQGVYSSLEGEWIAQFTPGAFHVYSFVSEDMLTYQLCIDGQIVHNGHLIGPGSGPGVGWGDAVWGASSLSTWDYVRFGTVPEPSAGFLAGSAALALMVGGPHRCWRKCNEVV